MQQACQTSAHNVLGQPIGEGLVTCQPDQRVGSGLVVGGFSQGADEVVACNFGEEIRKAEAVYERAVPHFMPVAVGSREQ